LRSSWFNLEMQIDYSKYTHAELLDVFENIDAEKYPERYKAIVDAINEVETKKWETKEHNKFVANPDEPVAKLTNWMPLKAGGSNFKTHRLESHSANKITFVPTLGLYFFSVIFSTISVIAFWQFSEPFRLHELISIKFENYFAIAISLFFIFSSGWLVINLFKQTVFDKTSDLFWNGWKKPPRFVDKTKLNITRLNRIYALQIISEYCPRNKGNDYYSYELNLVLKDGQRINVIDHGDYNALCIDTNVLAIFLDVPVWESIDERKQSWLERLFNFRFG
ncbi:MAG: hypothetical protein ACPGJI_09410, partial [Kangiellaceae bacterium]